MKFLSRIVLVLALLFPAVASAQFTDQRTWAPVSTGSANAQSVAIDNVSGPPLGVVFRFTPVAANTGAATLNVNSTGAKNITKPSPSGAVSLTGGELQIGQIVEAMYDGTNYQLVSNLNGTASSIFVTPQGYLTPCSQTVAVSGCPTVGLTANAGGTIPTGDVTGASTLYYQTTPGNQIPIWNGTQMVVFQFSELTLTLGSSNLANTIYDVCVTTTTAGAYAVNGTPTLMTMVAWTTSTNGSGARGTGAGSAQITRTNGIWTNAVVGTGKNGATTYSNIPANTCTIVGTILIDGTNGQVSFTRTVGISRKWSAWNFYNRQQISLTVSDPTTSWTYGSTTYRASRNQTTNSLIYLQGLQEEVVSVVNNQNATITGTVSNQYNAFCGIGLNATLNATVGYASAAIINTTATQNIGWTMVCTYTALPTLGASLFTSLEATLVTGTYTFFGTEANMRMTAQWRG